MKRNRILPVLLALALILSLAACTQAAPTAPTEAAKDPAEVAQGIYECMMKEDSEYTEIKGYYAAMPEVTFTETVDGGKITVSASGNEYAEGTWEYVVDGDYLRSTYQSDSMLGALLATTMGCVVGDYLGMDPDLVRGYVKGIGQFDIQSDDVRIELDEAAGTCAVSYRISGPYEMKELSQMVVDERMLEMYDPLEDGTRTVGFSVGKLTMVCIGSQEDCTFVVSEIGELDETALNSVRNAVAHFKPNGYEAFGENYTALEEIETDAYTVTFTPDSALLADYGIEQTEGRSYLQIHFGS